MSHFEDDVLIIGGGAIGLATALALLEAGRSVRVLEKATVGGATSHGNCGTITPSHAPPLAAPGATGQGMRWLFSANAPFYIRPRWDPALWHWLLRFALRCNLRDWRESTLARSALLNDSRQRLAGWVNRYRLECEFMENGLDYVFRNPKHFDHYAAECELLRGYGIVTEIIGAADYQRREPVFLPGLAGAIHFPADANLRPDRYTAELARVVRELGGIIEEHCPARTLQVDDAGAIVRTDTGVRRGRDAVVALAAWSPAFVKRLGLRLPIQPGKGYSITYSRPEKVPSRPVVLKDRAVFITSWSDGFRLGSTMEFSGYDTRLNGTRLALLERAASEYLHEPHGAEIHERWYGWRPMTWDDRPVLGRSPLHRHLWLAAGHGMLGISMSAASGQLIADMIDGRMPMIDPSPYRVERFQ
ncbi:MAG: FAD-dependent oxidoreductase [Xanthomonadaceae bacterium]|jgi:D-amino-acid dehydrogenase|nr:FAD-dependent oxidoreductase [Xanthomonadaceae bacterium]